MRNFKKVLAIVLSVLFVVPSMAFGSFAEKDAGVVNASWKYESVSAATAAAAGAGVSVTSNDPTTNTALTVTATDGKLDIGYPYDEVTGDDVPGSTFTVQAIGADVNNDEVPEYPAAISFMWTTAPEKRANVDNLSGAMHLPFGGQDGGDNLVSGEFTLALTLRDFEDGNTYYTDSVAGDNTANWAILAVWGGNASGYGWGADAKKLQTPVDLSQPITVSTLSYVEDGQWALDLVINGETVPFGGYAGAFNGGDDVPNNSDAPIFTFVAGAATQGFGAASSVDYAIGGLTVTPANATTDDGHNHVFTEWTLTQEQTCAQYAEYTSTCLYCNLTNTKHGTELNEHTWDNGVITRQATCNKTEKTTYTCTVCGATDERTTGEKLPHNWVDIEDERNVPATCTEPGVQYRFCDQRPGGHTGSYTVPALGHNVETWTEITPADCTHKAVEQGECTRCHEIIEREVGELAGHSYVLDGIHKGVAYYTCSVCGDKTNAALDASALADASSYGDGNLENDFWTVSVNDKVGTNMGIGAGYDDWMFVKINDAGNLYVLDTNYAFQDLPATAAAQTRVLSKYAADINGFTAEITPMPAWIDAGAALKFPWAQNYSFFWTNNPDAYRDATAGVTSRGFIKDGSNYDADDRSLEVVFADAVGYDGVADTLIVTATFQGTAYPFTYSINVPFAGAATEEAKRPNLGNPLTVEIINTATEFAVIAQGERYDFNDMIGVLSGDMYFGAQASTDWTNNAAVRALSTDFEISAINGEANTASWIATDMGHKWGEWETTDPGTCLTPSTQVRTCELCGETETQQGPVGGHVAAFEGIHAGVIYNKCSVCGDLLAAGNVADLDGEGTIVDDGDNYVSSNANGDPTIVQNDFWTATGVNADGTDLGIGNGYNNWFVTGIDESGNIFIKDEAQFFNDQPAASRAQSLIVSKFTTSVNGFTTVITPLQCEGANNGFTKFAQNYSVLFTNHPELYRDGKLVTQGFEGFIRSDDGVTHPADEMSFEIVLWNGNLQDNVTYLFVPSVVNGVVDAAINTMTALSAPADLTQNVNFGVSTENGLKVSINGVEYGPFATAAAAAEGQKFVGYQAGNSWNASQYRIMSARFVVAEINGAAGTATWHGEELPHVWGEWTVTTPAGYGVVGEKSHTCELCGAVETEEIPAKAYLLTFDANGGTVLGETSVSFGINYGETYRSATGWDEVPEPVRDGYIFDGWSYLGVYYLTTNALDDEYGLTSDGTFVAEWIADKPYTVTFDANGGTIDGAASKSFPIANGESYESATGWDQVPVPTREHYDFVGWVYEEYNYTLNNMQETYGVTWDATFTAHWELKREYNITWNADGGKINGEDSIVFPIGYMETYESATGWSEVPVPERYGYKFIGWVYEEYNYTLNNMREQYAVTCDAEFTAHWEELPPAEKNGMSITLHDYQNDIKDAFLIKGEFDSYAAIKAARENASYYYGIYAAKLARQNGEHTFTVKEEGVYTLLVRYTSDGEDYTYYTFVFEPQAEVTGEGGYVHAVVTGADVKVLRFAPGTGILSTAEMKQAEGVYGVVGSSFVNGEYTSNKKFAPGSYSYVIVLTNGAELSGNFEVTEAQIPEVVLPVTITSEGISGWGEDVSRVKYVAGEVTTMAGFRGDGVKYLRAPAEGDFVAFEEELSGTYSFQVILTNGEVVMKTLTF